MVLLRWKRLGQGRVGFVLSSAYCVKGSRPTILAQNVRLDTANLGEPTLLSHSERSEGSKYDGLVLCLDL